MNICVAAQGQASSVATTNTNNDNHQRQATEQQQPSSTTNKNTPTTTALQCTNAKVPVLLQTARARVFKVASPKATREVRIVFDSGSQRSYITSNVKKMLNLDSKFTETMLIKTFGSTKNGKQTCDVVSIGILLKDGGMLELSLLTVPLICEPLCGQPISCISENYEYISRLELADHSYREDKLNVDILIGSDQYWNLVTGNVIRKATGPIAVHTRLGWVLSGPAEEFLCQGTVVNLITTHTLVVDAYSPEDSKQDLNGKLKAFWDLESIGIMSNECNVYQEFEKSIALKGNRYEVSLPWKQFHPELPDHYDLSLKRLIGLLKRLRETPDVLKQYDSIIQDQIMKAIVEYVDTSKVP